MKYLFIDESGDHNLNPLKIDPTFPFFVLTGIVFEKDGYFKFKRDWLSIKAKIFGTTKIVIHSAELTRPNKSKQAKIKDLTNKKLRNRFYAKINTSLKNHSWSLLAFVINKPEFSKLFPEYPPDPYFLSFSYLISKFAEKLNKRETGKIFVEKRNGILDKQFMLAWKNAYDSRVGLVTNKELKEHNIDKPYMHNKSWDHTGLELADMVSYRISRRFTGKAAKVIGNEIDLEIIKKKQFDIAGLPGAPRL